MTDAPRGSTRAEAFRYWWKLGCISFGGPAGQIALMHRELVERRRWISEARFLHALNYCMVLPGPEAQQLATYIGWLMHRTRGGIVAGALFVLPSLLVLIALSWVYMAFGNVPAVAGMLYGIKPAVTAIVAHAAWRIGVAHACARRRCGSSPRSPSSRSSRSRCRFPASCWRPARSVRSAGASRRRSSPAQARIGRGAEPHRPPSSTTTRRRRRMRDFALARLALVVAFVRGVLGVALGALAFAASGGDPRSRRWAGSSPRRRC